jgi:hypothetical protein
MEINARFMSDGFVALKGDSSQDFRDNLILADTFPSCEKSSFRDKVFIQGIY